MAANTLPNQQSRGTNKAPVTQRSTPAEAAESVSLQPAAPATQPTAVDDEQIRARAYFLWEQAGHPAGSGAEFWLRAEQELKQRGS